MHVLWSRFNRRHVNKLTPPWKNLHTLSLHFLAYTATAEANTYTQLAMIIKFITLSVSSSLSTHLTCSLWQRVIEREGKLHWILGSPTPNIFTQITVYNSFWTAFSYSLLNSCSSIAPLIKRKRKRKRTRDRGRRRSGLHECRWNLSAETYHVQCFRFPIMLKSMTTNTNNRISRNIVCVFKRTIIPNRSKINEWQFKVQRENWDPEKWSTLN